MPDQIPERDDALMRGVVYGCLFSIPIWAVIIGFIWLLFRIF